MKYTYLIALIGMASAINMSAPEDCKKNDDKKDACVKFAGCSWTQGADETKGSCAAQAASSAQKSPDCKKHDDNMDSCSAAAGCGWTQGFGTAGSCKEQKAAASAV